MQEMFSEQLQPTSELRFRKQFNVESPSSAQVVYQNIVQQKWIKKSMTEHGVLTEMIWRDVPLVEE